MDPEQVWAQLTTRQYNRSLRQFLAEPFGARYLIEQIAVLTMAQVKKGTRIETLLPGTGAKQRRSIIDEHMAGMDAKRVELPNG